jgi:stage V sporulation protein AF
MSDTEKTLYTDYTKNVDCLRGMLRAESSFDILERHLAVCSRDMCFFFIDGFIKDAEMQRMMQTLLGLKEPASSRSIELRLPYVEIEREANLDRLVLAVLSGQTVILAESFGAEAIVADLRTYPARDTAEPEGDRVMQGARDGFVETLIMNTALIRRRIRDPRLRMEHFNLGGCSQTDVVICYMDGICDNKLLSEVRKRISSVRPKSLTLGYQSLAETLIRRGWANPFPKIRTTERPDTAAAQVLEGSVLVICDTSPQVMLLPTSIFDYISQTDDYYFPPLTGSYLRIIRTLILILSVVATPLWYLALMNADILPPALSFLVPKSPGTLPVLLQLVLVELAIDGLKIASMNTPDMLSNSLSVVGALLLGGLYSLFNSSIMPTVSEKITTLFNFTA